MRGVFFFLLIHFALIGILLKWKHCTGLLNTCVQHHFFPHLIKDLIERPFEVKVKILVNCNALQFSKVCFHCGAENGSHSWPTQGQNLKPKALNNYYTEVIDHFVESICQYKEK